jgi:predicted  nucleic acid-binding Zn-ribbon protein
MNKIYIAIPIALAILLTYAKSEINALQSRLHTISIEAEMAKHQLARQNQMIYAYGKALENAKKEADKKISVVRAESNAMKIKLTQELAKDNSCENRMNLIDKQLRIFYEQKY